MTTDWNKLTVVELRAELKKHGLAQAGKKADLIDRLSAAVANEIPNEANKEANDDDQPTEPQNEPQNEAIATPAPSDPMAEDSKQGVATETEPIADAPESVTLTPPKVNEPDPQISELVTEGLGAQPPAEPVTVTTINSAEDTGSGDSLPPAFEVIKDAQSRKRRSRTPSIDGSIRKRLRQDDPEPRQVDSEMADAADAQNGFPKVNGEAAEPAQESTTAKEELVEPQGGRIGDKEESIEPMATEHVPDRNRNTNEYDTSTTNDVVMGGAGDDQTWPGHDKPLPDTNQSHPADRFVQEEAPEPDFGGYERPVVPAMHPATSALYIKNFMRPLRPGDVNNHLVELATPPSKVPDPDVIVDFFLDPIRTHAFVSFISVSAASRVRSALHGQVWPDERNRKPLWVDFIPPEKVNEWIAREEADGGGRGKMNRWEVVYEEDLDGNMTARLEEAGADAPRQNPRAPAPPTGPASTSIPTGPSQMNTGIQGAPLGPRGRGGRVAPPFALQAAGNPHEAFKSTRALPSLLYKPASDEVVRRRLDNMRSFYTKDKYRDLGKEDEINRYTFENVDAFVDRGREVFVGIRPPHRERGRGGGRPTGPRRGPPPPPPPSFRPRGGDRYMGGRREDAAPRSRFNGAPLPTYEGRSDRRGRNGYGGYGR
jgi:SAP domain-containing ribonucleoprotein